MAFNRQFPAGIKAMIDDGVGGAAIVGGIQAILMSDTWDPEEDQDMASFSDGSVEDYLWDGVTANGGNATDDGVSVTVSSQSISSTTLSVIIADINFGAVSDTGGATLGSLGWVLLYVEPGATDTTRYPLAALQFEPDDTVGNILIFLADATGTLTFDCA